MHILEEHLLERPELSRVINNVQSLSAEGVYSFDVLNVFFHAHEIIIVNKKLTFNNLLLTYMLTIRYYYRLDHLQYC